jgi:hypothetical protein
MVFISWRLDSDLHLAFTLYRGSCLSWLGEVREGICLGKMRDGRKRLAEAKSAIIASCMGEDEQDFVSNRQARMGVGNIHAHQRGLRSLRSR